MKHEDRAVEVDMVTEIEAYVIFKFKWAYFNVLN